MEDLKRSNGNFKQEQTGRHSDLSQDHAIVCWFRVSWKILHIFFRYVRQSEVASVCFIPDSRSSVFDGKSCTIFIDIFSGAHFFQFPFSYFSFSLKVLHFQLLPGNL